MGTEYKLILKIQGNLVTLKVWGDNSCGTLVKQIIKIIGSRNYDTLKYCIDLDRYKLGGVYHGIKSVKMILDLLFPKCYDEKEIEIFKGHVGNAIRKRWSTDCDCDYGCDGC